MDLDFEQVSTDIPEPVMRVLSQSRILKVVLIGRRGPLQVAFTLKEIRELSKLQTTLLQTNQTIPTLINMYPRDLFSQTMGTHDEIEQILSGLPRPRRRLTEFLYKLYNDSARTSSDCANSDKHICDLQFLRSPIEIIPKLDYESLPVGKSAVAQLKLVPTKLEGPIGFDQKAMNDPNQPIEYIHCGLVVRSIGYRGLCLDPDLPFDNNRGVIACQDIESGRISDLGQHLYDFRPSPMYCTGWIKRGPVGVIVDTTVDARQTAKAVLADLDDLERNFDRTGRSDIVDKPGLPLIRQFLKERDVRPVFFDDWERIDKREILAGKSLGKPREKLTSIESILQAAFVEIVEHHLKKY